MGHFNIPKLHALTHYVDWIKEKGTLNNVNTAVTETMHKMVKDAFRNSNKVDYVSHMCFWDDRRLSVEMRNATLRYLSIDESGHWSEKIQCHFDVENQIRPRIPLLAGLAHAKLLSDVEKSMNVTGFQKAMVSYIQQIRQRFQGDQHLREHYDRCLEKPEDLVIRQASSASLVYQTFQEEDVFKKHHVRCTQNWRGKRSRTDFVLFQNEVVGSKKSFDAF